MWTESIAPVAARGLSDQEVKSLVAQIDRKGFAFVENYLDPQAIGRARSFVASAIEKAGGTYVGFNDKAAVAGSGLDLLADDPSFRSIFSRMYELSLHRPAPPVEFYQVLRCLTGATVAKHSLNFHYDSYVITALIPIEIPTEGMTGDFLMIPNTRSVRATYAANLVDKALLDNKATQFALRHLSHRTNGPMTRIKMVPGNLYFFWGYRSVHTNEACDPDKVRATALYHYANPHADSPLRKRLGREN